MSKIHVLNQDLANKIAAGEVVERPGSVVKELVENALDAGATHITVEIKNGGISYIRVTDDGCGMSREDVRNCFLRHATSKINDVSDLYAIQTLGFRGEALAAISAVSIVEVITSSEGVGTRLVLHAGKEVECEDAGAPIGTTMIVRDLFHNTPARIKFLKSDRAEGSFVAALMDRLALSNPNVAFRFIQEGKVSLSTDGSGNLLDVIYAVFGREVTKGMLQVDNTLQQIRVYGYVGLPTVTKSNRNSQLCYINGRLVRSQTVLAAIDQAYKNDLFHGRHAVCVLKLVLPYGLVDVNVHPSKMEVKFSNEKLIFEAVYYAIKNALNKQTLSMAADQSNESASEVAVTAPKPLVPEKKPGNVFGGMVDVLETPRSLHPEEQIMPSVSTKPEEKQEPIISVPKKPTFSVSRGIALHETRPELPSEPEYEEIPKTAVAFEEAPKPPVFNVTPQVSEQLTMSNSEEDIPYRYIGEVFKSYLLVESDDQLYLIDKHAAHERMIFEKLLAEASADKCNQQVLLVPEQIALAHEEVAFALEHKADFEEIGFEIDAFGDRDIVIRSRPVCIANEETAAVFGEILADWMRGGRLERTERENRALKTVACKAAIKAGNLNDSAELKALVIKLIREDAVHQCPHGRPIMIAYSKKTIEKAFKRI